MNTSIYNPPEPDGWKNLPDVLRSIVKPLQATKDAEYRLQLDNYFGACEAYIQGEIGKRQTSGDPEHYTAAPFRASIPRRVVVSYDAQGLPTWVEAEPDPNIHAPVLPPYEKPSTGPGFSTAGGQQAATVEATMLGLLMSLHQKLDQLLARK